MTNRELENALSRLESADKDDRHEYRIAYNNVLNLLNNNPVEIILNDNIIPHIGMLGVDLLLNDNLALFRQLYKVLKTIDKEDNLVNNIYDVITLDQFKKLPELWNLDDTVSADRLDLVEFLLTNTNISLRRLDKAVRFCVENNRKNMLQLLENYQVYKDKTRYKIEILTSRSDIKYLKNMIKELNNKQIDNFLRVSIYKDVIDLVTYDKNNFYVKKGFYENIMQILTDEEMNTLIKNILINDDIDLINGLYSLYNVRNIDTDEIDKIVYTNISIIQFEKLFNLGRGDMIKVVEYNRPDIIENQLNSLDSITVERMKDVAEKNNNYTILEILKKYGNITPQNKTNSINTKFIKNIQVIMKDIDDIEQNYPSVFIRTYTDLMDSITYYDNENNITISDDIVNILDDNDLRYLARLFIMEDNIEFFNQIYEIMVTKKPDIDLEDFDEFVYEEITEEQYSQLSDIWYSLIEATQFGRPDLVKYLLDEGEDIELNDAIESAITYNFSEILTMLQNYNLHTYITTIAEINKTIEDNYDLHDNDDQLVSDISGRGDVETLKYLKELGLDLHRDNDSALIEAVVADKLDNVKYLISEGIISQFDKALSLSKGETKKYLESIKTKEKLSLSQQRALHRTAKTIKHITSQADQNRIFENEYNKLEDKLISDMERRINGELEEFKEELEDEEIIKQQQRLATISQMAMPLSYRIQNNITTPNTTPNNITTPNTTQNNITTPNNNYGRVKIRFGNQEQSNINTLSSNRTNINTTSSNVNQPVNEEIPIISNRPRLAILGQKPRI